MRNRACAHCSEQTLSAVKLALSGPQNAVRCGRCGGYSTTAASVRARWFFMTLGSAAAAAVAIEVWGELVGMAIVVAGVGGAFAWLLQPVPAVPVWPQRSLVPPAMLAALVPAVAALAIQWSDGIWTWTDDVLLPVWVWMISLGPVICFGAPLVWCLRRIGRQGYVAYAIAGAIPMAVLAAVLATLPVKPWPVALMVGLGATIALAFRFAARGRLPARAGEAPARRQSA